QIPPLLIDVLYVLLGLKKVTVLLRVNIQYFNYTGFMGLSLCSIHPLSDDIKKQRSTPLLSGSSHLFSPQNCTSRQRQDQHSQTLLAARSAPEATDRQPKCNGLHLTSAE
uniref:Uncharacterized protein n=1 Tax=Otus sunia TaxID=257818 RepID=A0A8C8E5F6_9STRI